MWYIHIMKYYSAIKRNVVLTCAVTWMNLENICYVTEARHKKPRILWFHLYEMCRIGKSIETKK